MIKCTTFFLFILAKCVYLEFQRICTISSLPSCLNNGAQGEASSSNQHYIHMCMCVGGGGEGGTDVLNVFTMLTRSRVRWPV